MSTPQNNIDKAIYDGSMNIKIFRNSREEILNIFLNFFKNYITVLNKIYKVIFYAILQRCINIKFFIKNSYGINKYDTLMINMKKL